MFSFPLSFSKMVNLKKNSELIDWTRTWPAPRENLQLGGRTRDAVRQPRSPTIAVMAIALMFVAEHFRMLGQVRLAASFAV